MKYCRSCILPDSRPGIELNEEGICSACIGAREKKEAIDWVAREKELVSILEAHKAKGREYDCIVPVSGGKDSTWQVSTLKEKYGMKPLCITYKCQCRTQLGSENLNNLISLGVDHIDFSINPKVEKRFMLKSLEKNGSVSLIEHMAIWAITLKMAVRLGIKLVVWGENSGLEYGGSKEDRESPYLNYQWIRKYGATNGTFAEDWADDVLTLKDLNAYQLPREEEFKGAQIKSIFLGWFLKWDPLEVAQISRGVGFKWADRPVLGYYPFADLDSDFIIIHHFFKWYKFGMTRLWDNLAIEIRNNRMTREEAVKYIKDNPESLPLKQIRSLCNFLGISEGHFWAIVERHRNREIWKKDNNGQWHLPALEREFGFRISTYSSGE